MKQEEKNLLLRDLLARLPYGVKVLYENKVFSIDYISAIYEEIKLDIPDNYTINISDIKPYFFPLSSMTEEQEDEWYRLYIQPMFDRLNVKDKKEDLMLQAKSLQVGVDYLIANHFDYRGLIPMGLAQDATGLNIY